jgi:hypothetical protein
VSEVDPFARFAGLTYERFRALAQDSRLSASERVGFPDAMREGYEDAILADLVAKLPALGRPGRKSSTSALAPARWRTGSFAIAPRSGSTFMPSTARKC